ncbi:calcium-binding protein, partial [Dolichospermum sp. UHCC 0684]
MNTILNSALTLTYNQLSTFSGLDNFWQVFDTAFGTQYNRSGAEILRLQWLSGDFSQVPQIEILDSNILGGANGAYASSTNKIYLSANFVATATQETLVDTLLEEIGHFVDAQINLSDSAGDEGAIFAELVQGYSLDIQTLQALKAEDDHGTITVNGQVIQVEQQNFTGTSGNDTITGTIGNDVISGLDGNDTLNGGTGNDDLYGGNGNDAVNGEAGDDTLYSDAGSDNLNGGTGFDYYNADYSNRATGLTMTYDPTTSNGTITIGTEVDTLTSIESFNDYPGFQGTNFDDVIVGTSDNESWGIYGRDGNDNISGGAGNDKLYGQEGNDTLNGGTGNDDLYGGN